MHHTNIVPVFGVGECEGTHYYVMQFIQGQGLNVVLDELKKLRDARAAKPAHKAKPGNTEKQRAAADIAHSLATGRFVGGPGTATLSPADSATAAWAGATLPPAGTSVHQAESSVSAITGTSGVSTLSETDRRFALGVARIGLQVAQALAHAHGQGILHRDIKPSNLLLDRDGNVWVADFGLAKATGADDLTHTGDIVGTVRYMAPERFRGESDARSDLYALGLTLYELLALRPAFDEADRASLMRQVTQEDPPRLRKLNARVPLDLETIIHKAIAREPGGRYASARTMVDDIERFLDGRPILARRVSTSERVYRWCRRNKAVAALLGAVAALLVAGFAGASGAAVYFRQLATSESAARRDADLARIQAGGALRQAVAAQAEANRRRREAETSSAQALAEKREAEASFALARKAVDDSFTKISESSLVNVPGLRPLRRELLESSLAFYEEFLRRKGDDPTILADLAATQLRVGQILADLSERDKARTALQQAVQLYEKALAARPGEVAMLERQSEAWHRLGDLDYPTSDGPRAYKAYQSAVAIRERLAALYPREPRYRMALSRSFNGLALTVASDPARLAAYRRSLELRLKLADEIPEDPDLLHGLSESFLNLGTMLRGNNEHWEEALVLAKHSIEYGRAGLARRGHDFEFATDLGISYSTAASLCWQLSRRAEALAISAQGVEFARKLALENPDVPAYHVALANYLGTHAAYLRETGRISAATLFCRQAAETLETMPDQGATALATASFYRTQVAALLGGKSEQDFKTWPEAARREAELSIVDLKGAVAHGFRNASTVRTNRDAKALLGRDDMKALLAEMESPPGKPATAQTKKAAGAVRAPTPLDEPGRLEEDRFLGELTIALLDEDAGATNQTRSGLETILARIDARRRSGAESPALEASARSVKLAIGERLWKTGELAEASASGTRCSARFATCRWDVTIARPWPRGWRLRPSESPTCSLSTASGRTPLGTTSVFQPGTRKS